MRIERVPLARIKEDPKNARRHPAKNLQAIRRSLKRFGQRLPLVVRGNVVVVGNGRLRVMRELGWEKADIIRADDLTEKEAQAFEIVDNESPLSAEWDDPMLAELLTSFDDADLVGDIGWDDKRLAGLLAGISIPDENKKIDEDDMRETDHECPKCGFRW